MRIKKVKIPEDKLTQYGLKRIDMDRLGQVVAIVGRNGSGKTRFLNFMESLYYTCVDYNSVIDGWISNLPTSVFQVPPHQAIFQEVIALQKEIELLETEKTSEEVQERRQKTWQKIQKISNRSDFQSASNLYNQHSTRFSQTFGPYYSSHFQVIEYATIKALGIASNNSFEKMVENLEYAQTEDELSIINSSALQYLQRLPHDLVEASTTSKLDDTDFSTTVAAKRFRSLAEFVQKLLHKELEWEKSKVSKTRNQDDVQLNFSGRFLIDGRPFSHNEFSEGEKVLFGFALLFFLLDQNPKGKIKDSVIVIDEPELHLHPSMEITLINRLRDVVGETGQIWIATHSLSILSHLQPDEIFMMKEGQITSPNRYVPGETLRELMQLDSHLDKLKDFINSISDWAFVNFITQCFDEPNVIESAIENDPQVETFKSFLSNLENGTTLLDFGAGKGRLIKEIKEESNLQNAINISALEPDPENQQILLASGIVSVYNRTQDLPNSSFDVIVLCNVLHEISISDWVDTLNNIKRALRDNGYLLLIEDKTLPKGEKIGIQGFHILDLYSIKELFQLAELPSAIVPSEKKYSDRILCCPIPAATMKEVSNVSLKKCLKSLESSIMNEIKKLRSLESEDLSDAARGRLAAFHSQHYINTVLALEELGKN